MCDFGPMLSLEMYGTLLGWKKNTDKKDALFDHFVSTLTVGECGLRSASVALRPGLRLKCILNTLHTQLINSIIHTLAVMKSKPFWVHTSTGSLYVFVHQEQSKQVSMSATVNRLCAVTRQSGGPLLHPTITRWHFNRYMPCPCTLPVIAHPSVAPWECPSPGERRGFEPACRTPRLRTRRDRLSRCCPSAQSLPGSRPRPARAPP